MRWKIDQAHPDDLAYIFSLLAKCQLPTAGLAEHWATALVARTESQVVGSAALELYGASALLRSVAVDESARGQGIGQALTQAALDLAQRNGVKAVYLFTETASGFFTRFGFRPLPRERVPEEVQQSIEFRSLCPASAQAMVLAFKEVRMTRRDSDPEQIKDEVRAHYAKVARVILGGPCGCKSEPSCCSEDQCGTQYASIDLAEAPGEAVVSSLGCGNPIAVADLKPGEVVLDLGSGGGLDVILAARRVGPTGRVYGLDMTDEMLALAEHNVAQAGLANVRFLKGDIEDIPLPDASVDVVISNCVINLAPDKRQVLQEAFRVLKPGGRLAVSDTVFNTRWEDLPVREDEVRTALSWAGCVAGALTVEDYRRFLVEAGFEQVCIEVGPGLPQPSCCSASLSGEAMRELASQFASAIVTAHKPKAR